MGSTPHTIPTTGSYPLDAILWTAADVPHGAVVMHPAMDVPQRIYQAFTKFLAERGFHTITYDYRGIGASRSKSLRRFAACMCDWALSDAEGVMRWTRACYPELPHLAVGYPVGGHATDLCSVDWDVAGVMQVACHTGNARFIHQCGERWRVDLILRGAGPLMARLIGYAPGRRMDLGEDLLGGVAIEWGAWAGMQHYFSDDPTLGAIEHFNRVTHPVFVYGFDDDPWATPAAINASTMHFMNTWVGRRRITPTQAGGAVGHMDLFYAQFATTLQSDLVDWLRKRAATTCNGAEAA